MIYFTSSSGWTPELSLGALTPSDRSLEGNLSAADDGFVHRTVHYLIIGEYVFVFDGVEFDVVLLGVL